MNLTDSLTQDLRFGFRILVRTPALTAVALNVSGDDPGTLLAALLALCMVSVGAALAPATRASRVDPAIALRQE